MKKKTTLTKTLALTGTVFVWLPLLVIGLGGALILRDLYKGPRPAG